MDLFKYQQSEILDIYKGLTDREKYEIQETVFTKFPSFVEKYSYLDLNTCQFPEYLTFKKEDKNSISFNFDFLIDHISNKLNSHVLTKEDFDNYLEIILTDLDSFIQNVQSDFGLIDSKDKDFLYSFLHNPLNDKTINDVNSYFINKSNLIKQRYGYSIIDIIKAYMGIKQGTGVSFPRLYFTHDFEIIRNLVRLKFS